MRRGAWWAAVHRVVQSQTRLKWLSMHACTGEGNGNPLQYSCLEIPGMEKPGGLPSMGSHRVGHNWSDVAAADHLLEWLKPVVRVPGNVQIHDILWSLEMPRILLFLWFCCYFFLQMLSYTSMLPINPICGPKPVMISTAKLPENHPPFAALFDPQKA